MIMLDYVAKQRGNRIVSAIETFTNHNRYHSFWKNAKASAEEQ